MQPKYTSSRFADLFFAQTLQQQFNTLGLRVSNQNIRTHTISSIFKK